MVPDNMPTDTASTTSRRLSWSVRLDERHVRIVERGCAVTHGGVASWFVERAFLEFAAFTGATPLKQQAPPLIEPPTRKQALENIELVQTALAESLERRAAPRKTFYARPESLSLLYALLSTGTAQPSARLPETPLLAPFAQLLSLRLLPIHLTTLADMATRESVTKADIIAASLEHAATNLGLNARRRSDVDENGLPRTMLYFPHPELIWTSRAIEDTILALIVAYTRLAHVKQEGSLQASSRTLLGVIPRVTLGPAGR